MQILAQVVSIAIALVGITLFVRAIRQIVAVVTIGQPAHRTDNPGARAVTLVRETLGHTRMLQWTWVGAGHWFVMVGFGLLFFTLVTAFGQLFDAHFALPLIGHFFLWEWVTELFTAVMLVAIIAFIGYRATRPSERERGPKGRFFGSTMWQGYFVEMVILGVGLCIATLRGLEYALLTKGGEYADNANALHFPLSFPLGLAFDGLSTQTIENLIYFVAMLKIVISFTWMIVISRIPTMGVAWHRFLAFFNIYLKRNADGRTALGGLAPMTSGGKPVDFEDLEEMDEDTVLGVGKVEDFSWKGILDFSTCTECGRCQSQCPAWNTEKPLSPKMLVLQLRDHAHAKAPYLLADSEEARAELPADVLAQVDRPLVGETEGWAWDPTGGAVIDDDVLWSCTSCGACVQQCPVDIEHVDHIVDMRRYQVLVESNFPTELNGLFKGLENKGNPWNMSPTSRMDWAKDLPFEVKVVGEDVESLDDVEWLFWVGCAGAYEDRAKKTTRAVAELLDIAGVDFAVLGNGETCTGDPARRAGNEFVFQGLAAQNAETLKENRARKVVSTCAHCFNTLKNEYAAFGVELEVVHHTQLLNRLVREKKLAPVASANGSPKRSITYHDPCYLGRHNQVYSPPRELLNVIPDAELTEMPRNSERSFCCGAGGARMWMEENIGERINVNRTKEAVATGADQIAVGCPFCRVMLSDGLTAEQAKGEAREEVEVLDIAQMLLASVKGETRAPVPAKATATAGTAGATGAAAAAVVTDEDAVKAEPEAGDATQTAETVTETEDVGPLAKASGGSSLFDTEPDTEPDIEPEASRSTEERAPEAASGGSLFDLGGEGPTAPAPATEEPAATNGGSLFDLGDDSAGTGTATTPDQEAAPERAAADGGDSFGSLFDLGGETTPTAPADAEQPTTQQGSTAPATEIPEGGSLFDLGGGTAEAAPADAAPSAPEASSTTEATPAAEQPSTQQGSTAPATEIPEGGSLFDLGTPAAAPTTPDATSADETLAEAPAVEQPEQARASTGAAAFTPGTEIPEGGSLFDIEAPTAEPASAPAPASDEATPRDHDAAADSTTDGPVDRSQDAADTDVAPSETPELRVQDAQDTTPAAAPSPSSDGAGRTSAAFTPGTEIPEGGSLFDIEAPTAEPASAPAPASDDTTPRDHDAAADSTTDGPVDRSQDAADTDVAPSETPEPRAAEAGGEAGDDAGAAEEAPLPSLRDIKAKYRGGDTSPTGTDSGGSAGSDAEQPGTEQSGAEQSGAAPTEPSDEPTPRQDEGDEDPRSPSPGAAHQPRTDAEIPEGGSLFDL